MRRKGRQSWDGVPQAPDGAAQPGGYTPEQLAQMAQMQGFPPASGYTPEQLAQMAQMQGFPPTAGFTPEQLAQMAQMQSYPPASGYTPEQMAQMAQMQGFPPTAGYTPEQLAQIAQMQGFPPTAGYTPEQIAQMQGFPPEWSAAAMGGYSPEQLAQMAQAQGFQPEQIAGMLHLQGFSPEQIAMTSAMRGCAPEQVALMLQMQGYTPVAGYDMPPAPTSQISGGVRVKKHTKPKRPPKPPLSTGQKLLRIALALVLVAGATWFVLRNFVFTGATTAVIEASEIGNVYSGDALIVRNESAYDEEGVQSIDYVAQEGGVAYRGDIVCYVYSTGYSAKETATLQDFRDQIKDYQRTLLKSETSYDQKMTRLENDVIQRGLEVRSLVQGARGDLISQEKILESSITQRQNYFRSKYSSDMRLNRLYDDENTQQRRIEGWIKQKIATDESIVSFYTDGFEYALSPSRYESYSPSQVRSMINGEIPDLTSAARGRTNMYRLVLKTNYAVLLLIKDNVWNPVEGEVYKLVLEQFSDTTVNARVNSFTRSGGELLVRLAVIGDVTDVLYMRTCRAQLGEYVDCLSVPVTALYEQNESRGVVIVTPEKQNFVPVNVLREENGRAYIIPITTGILSAGQTVRLFP